MTAAETPHPGAAADRTATLAALALSVPLGVVTGAVGAALPLLREVYGLAPGGGVELVVVYNVGALLALLVLGRSGRVGARTGTVLTALTLLFALSCAGMALAVWSAPAGGWGLLLALAAPAGAGFGGLILLLNSYAGANVGDRQVTVLNLLHACFGAGAVAGPLLMASGAGVAPVLAVTAVAAVCCLPVRRAVPAQPAPPPGATTAPPPDGGAGPARAPLVLLALFAAVSLLYAGLEVSTAALASTHLTDTGHAPSQATALAGLFWAGLTVGRLVIPTLARGRDHARLALTGLLAGAVALASTAVPGWAPAGYALAGLGFSVVFPTVLAWAFTTFGDGRRVASVLLVANLAGSAALPGAVAAAGSGGGAAIPAALTALALLTAAVLLAPLRAARRSAARPLPDPRHAPSPERIPTR